MKNITLEWFLAAAVRAIKTVAQTALGMVGVGMAFDEVNWKYVASVSVVAGVLSILTSLAGLPEVGTDGTLKIDASNPEKTKYLIDLSQTDLAKLPEKNKITLCVDANANLSDPS